MIHNTQVIQRLLPEVDLGSPVSSPHRESLINQVSALLASSSGTHADFVVKVVFQPSTILRLEDLAILRLKRWKVRINGKLDTECV